MSLERSRNVRAIILGSLLAIGAVLFGSVGASAHGGPYDLAISPDGVGGITVIGHYVEDGHVVDAILDPVATATSPDGRTAGPVELVSSSEGEGVWVTAEPFLDDGTWTVTVETTMPLSVTASTEFEVAPLAAPIDGEAANPAADASAATFNPWPWGAGVAVLVAIAVVVALILRRVRTRGPAAPAATRSDELVH